MSPWTIDMWFVASLGSGMADIPAAALGVFRVVLGLAFVWKFCWEHRWGAARYFDHDALHRWRYEHDDLRIKVLVGPQWYRVLYCLRAVAAGCLLLGLGTQFAAAALAAWCFFEYTFDRKSSHAFLGVCAALLCLSGSSEQYLSLDRLLSAQSVGDFLATGAAGTPAADPWPQILLVLAAIHLYWSSAWHKLRSAQFMSGDALQKAFEQLALIHHELPRKNREYWFPEWFNRRFATGNPEDVRRRWKGPAVVVVAVEASLPLLLLIPQTWLIGALLGVLLHAGFTSMMPKRLLPFTLATIGSYPLFVDPVVLSHWLGS